MLRLGANVIDGASDRRQMLKRLSEETFTLDPAAANTPAMAATLRTILAGFGRTAGRIAELYGPEAGRQFVAEVSSVIPREEELRAVLGEDAAAEFVRIIQEAVQ
jgi:hypothetical protein